jgi:hypothetical protein
MSVNSNTTSVQTSGGDVTKNGEAGDTYMADPLTTAAAGIEVTKTGIGIYKTGKEIFEALNTNYGKLGVSFTFILKFHNNIPLESNPIYSIIKDLGAKKENSIYRVNIDHGHIIINHIGYETKDDDDIAFEDFLELSGTKLPDRDIFEKYEDLMEIPISLIDSVFLFSFLNSPDRNSIVNTYNFFDEVNKKFNITIPVKTNSLFIRIKSETDKKIIDKLVKDLNKTFSKNNIHSTVNSIRDTSGYYIKYKLTSAIQAQIIDELLFEGIIGKIRRAVPLCFL